MIRFDGKTIVVVGLSVEGRDTLDFFLQTNCILRCCDRRN